MGALNPTPDGLLCDGKGRPYFLWDLDITLDDFCERLAAPDPVVAGYMAAKLMRQAKPDDVLRFLTVDRMRDLWPHLDRHLGQSRPFWVWLLDAWGGDERAA